MSGSGSNHRCHTFGCAAGGCWPPDFIPENALKSKRLLAGFSNSPRCRRDNTRDANGVSFLLINKKSKTKICCDDMLNVHSFKRSKISAAILFHNHQHKNHMQNETLPETASPASQPVAITKSPDGIPQVIGIAGVALAISFFLPWLNILGIRPSGFDLQGSNSGAIVFWVLPFFAVV